MYLQALVIKTNTEIGTVMLPLLMDLITVEVEVEEGVGVGL